MSKNVSVLMLFSFYDSDFLQKKEAFSPFFKNHFNDFSSMQRLSSADKSKIYFSSNNTQRKWTGIGDSRKK